MSAKEIINGLALTTLIISFIVLLFALIGSPTAKACGYDEVESVSVECVGCR